MKDISCKFYRCYNAITDFIHNIFWQIFIHVIVTTGVLLWRGNNKTVIKIVYDNTYHCYKVFFSVLYDGSVRHRGKDIVLLRVRLKYFSNVLPHASWHTTCYATHADSFVHEPLPPANWTVASQIRHRSSDRYLVGWLCMVSYGDKTWSADHWRTRRRTGARGVMRQNSNRSGVCNLRFR